VEIPIPSPPSSSAVSKLSQLLFPLIPSKISQRERERREEERIVATGTKVTYTRFPPAPSLPHHSRHFPQLLRPPNIQGSCTPVTLSVLAPAKNRWLPLPAPPPCTSHDLPRDMIALQPPAELSCPPTPLTPSCCLPAAALNRKGLPLFASAERFGELFLY
jgi:hypothetical protein